MSRDSPGTPRPLPVRPNLQHLKAQAKDLVKAGAAKSISEAQFQVARLYGFASWPRLKAHIEALTTREAQPDQLTPTALVAAITMFLADQDLLTLTQIREALDHELTAAGPRALMRLHEGLLAETGWDFSPADPLAKRVHRVLADRLLEPGSTLVGIDHVHAIGPRPVVIVSNHLSYADANLIEILLQRSGGAALADRLVAIAGPKVYSSRKRRFSSLCFGTIKTPQSSAVSTDEATMSPRDVARAARQSIDVAHERLRLGDALLVFAEGTRSRTRALQGLLTGAARYLEGPDAWVLPVGIIGTDAMFPIGEDVLHRVRIEIQVGRPFAARVLQKLAGGDRQVMMNAVGLAIAELLPAAYRGAYRDGRAELAAAERVLVSARTQERGE
jgi:1-acyl-sn-glycerol-3-phosphate acyltransferase